MFNDKIILVVILLIGLIPISTVSAEEISTAINDLATEEIDDSIIESIDKTNKEYITISENNIIEYYNDQFNETNNEIGIQNKNEYAILKQNEESIDNDSRVITAYEGDVISFDKSKEANSILSSPYNVYLNSLSARYHSNNYFYFGWSGYFDSLFKVYKGSVCVYSEYISGYDKHLKWSINNLGVGTYKAILYDDWLGDVYGSATIKIVKSSSKISVKSFTSRVGTIFYCYAYVKDKYTGNNYNGGTVTFKIAGKIYKAKLYEGVAIVKFKIPSKTKKYKCSAKFSGGSNVYGSSTTFKMKVKPKLKYKTITVSAKYKWIVKKKGKYTLKARLWRVYSGIWGYYNDVDIMLFKNGKQLSNSKYLSTYKYKINGKSKWMNWRHGKVNHAYHRYMTKSSVSKIKVKFLP